MTNRSPAMRGQRGSTGATFHRHVRRTVVFNVVGTGCSAGGGLLLARYMTSADRGAFAGVQSWFWAALVIGELGIPAALTYYIAHDPGRRPTWLHLAQRLLWTSGGITAAIGLGLSFVLARGSVRLGLAYGLVFALTPLAMVLGSYMFVLQSSALPRWNLASIVQPALYLAGVLALVVLGHPTVLGAVGVLAATVLLQGLLSRRLANQGPAVASGPLGRRDIRRMRSELTRYGRANLLASAPTLVNTRFDQLMLSLVSSLAGLGQYAVAVAISSLALPAVAAFGQVAFPTLANADISLAERRDTLRKVRLRAPIAAALVLAPLWLVTRLLTPHVLPSSYSDVPTLVLILAPGAVTMAAGNTLGDALRGLGRPGAVGIAQLAGAVLTVIGLSVAVPMAGVVGAAIVSSVAYTVVWAMLLRSVHRDHLSAGRGSEACGSE